MKIRLQEHFGSNAIELNGLQSFNTIQHCVCVYDENGQVQD